MIALPMGCSTNNTLSLFLSIKQKNKLNFVLCLQKLMLIENLKYPHFFSESIFSFLSPSQLYLYFWALFQDFYQESLLSLWSQKLTSVQPKHSPHIAKQAMKETMSLNCLTVRTDFGGSLNFSISLISRRVYFHC